MTSIHPIGISPSGRETGLGFFALHSVAMVNGPSLPTYIVTISISFDGTESELVIPVDSPVVLNADVCSNSMSLSAMPGSNADITAVWRSIQITARETIMNA